MAISGILSLEYDSFVEAAHITCLDRKPTAAEKSASLQRLNAGCGKIALLRDLSNSQEAKDRGLQQPDDLAAILANGGLYPDLLDEFFALDEVAFIHFSYRTLLRREADDDGLKHFIASLRRGRSRLEVLDKLLQSAEARAKAVEVPGLRRAIGQQKPFFEPTSA